MKAMLTLAAIAAVATTAPLAADEPVSKGETKLAKMLEGRVAGEPTRCINTFGNGSLQIIDDTALVYRQGRTLWVNRTANPRGLDSDDYLVIRKFGSGSQLCRLDNVTTQDRSGNFFTGVVFLEDFVPYRKAEG
jgi:hypothetical protein